MHNSTNNMPIWESVPAYMNKQEAIELSKFVAFASNLVYQQYSFSLFANGSKKIGNRVFLDLDTQSAYECWLGAKNQLKAEIASL